MILHPEPPGRLLLLQLGDSGADPPGRGGIAFAVEKLGAHQAEPGRRVALADAARGLLTLGPLQVGAGGGQITHPQPDGGQLPADVGQVTPRAELLTEGTRLLERHDRGRVVAAQPGELGQLYEHGGRSPRLAQGPEGGQRVLAIRLGPVQLPNMLPNVPRSSGTAARTHGSSEVM